MTVRSISLNLIAVGGARVVGRDLVDFGTCLYRVVGWHPTDRVLLLEPVDPGPDGFDPD